MCKKLLKLEVLALVFVVFLPMNVRANEVDVAKQRLSREIALLDSLVPEIERLDQARLIILKKAVLTVKDSIEKNGLSNRRTMGTYQELIVKFRFSAAFFTEISTPRTVEAIKELLSINEKICDARGFDDTPYTKITQSVYTHMKTLFDALLKNRSIPEKLRTKVQNLIVPIGKLVSDADVGDRPNTFDAGIKFYKLVVDVYPEFDEIQNSHEAFNIVLEIQGLNEFYGEYAQVTYQQDNK